MNNYEEYYKKIKNARHHELMELVKDIKSNIQNVIELGCGSGRDTIYLLNERIQCFRNR